MLPDSIRRLFRIDRGHASVESDLDAELRFHLDMKVEALVASGMSREDARDEALRQFGDLRRARGELAAIDHGQAARRLRKDWWESLWQDVRHAARGIGRTPAFSAAVVLTLAFGIGGAAAMFSLLDRLLLSAPEGVRDPGRVVRLYVEERDSRGSATYRRGGLRYLELRDFAGIASVPDVALYTNPDRATLQDAGATVPLGISTVSSAFFGVLGVRPALGRFFLPGDDSAGSAPVAVVSEGLWRRWFGGDASVLGRVVRVSSRTYTGAVRSQAYTVVGVAPKGFSGMTPEVIDLWAPAGAAGDALYPPQWRAMGFGFSAVARLAPGAGRERAAEEATVVFRRRQSAEAFPYSAPPDPHATVVLGSIIPGRSQLELDMPARNLRLSLVIAGVALIVCLIAVANVANLLLLRSLGRRRETGIRLALGVNRGRLMRAVLTESLLFAVVAGVLAGGVASVGGELLRKLLVRADWAEPLLGLRVFAFVGFLTLGVGILTGLPPAISGIRADVVASLRAGVRLSGWSRARLRGALLVAQVSLTLVLLAGLGLFVRSYVRARRVDFGVDADRLLIAQLAGGREGVPAGVAAELLARIRAFPGVRAAALADVPPLYGLGFRALSAEGVDSNLLRRGTPAVASVGDGYLAAAGLAVVRGRPFSSGDFTFPPVAALVDESMARRLWPAGDAMGKCLYVKFGAGAPPCASVIGIVRDVRASLTQAGPPQCYVPLAADQPGSLARWAIVRAAGDPQGLVRPLRDLVAGGRPGVADDIVLTLASVVEPQVRPWRLAVQLLGMFGALAVLLAMVGLYSVVAFAASQRTHEFGIRTALGARGWDLAALVFRQALWLAGLGVLLGLGLALAAGRIIASQLFDTTPRDPLVLAGAGILLLIAAVAACGLPARSAATVDPRISLQAD